MGGRSFHDVIPGAPKDLDISKTLMDQISEASASRIEIASQMRMEPDSELTEAVDKLAKAEAMCSFAGAVKAAEAAAEGKSLYRFEKFKCSVLPMTRKK